MVEVYVSLEISSGESFESARVPILLDWLLAEAAARPTGSITGSLGYPSHAVPPLLIVAVR